MSLSKSRSELIIQLVWPEGQGQVYYSPTIDQPPMLDIMEKLIYHWYTNRGQIKYIPQFFRYMQFTDHNHGWLSALEEGAFYRTTNGGSSWKDTPYEYRSGQFFNSFYFFNNKSGIASSLLFNNIMTTWDGSLNWSYEERLQPAQLNAITFVNDTTGFAVGTNGAILKYHGSYFNPDNTVQTSSRLNNFPNPFNDKTAVNFYLSEPQTVTISIFDMLGRCIGTFILNDTVAGKNVFRWRPDNVSSGVFLIRLSCNEFTKVIKSLYIK